MPTILVSGRRRHWRQATLAIGAVVVTAISLTSPALGASADPEVTTSSASAKPSMSTEATDYTAGTYIVQVAGEPLATYAGDVPGLSATRPGRSKKLNTTTAAAQAYSAHLAVRQRDVLSTVGASATAHHTVVFNGATAALTAQQAAKLVGSADVVALTKDTLRQVTTNESPAFLGMPELWSQAGGQSKAGSGVVVGVLDTGIWPENASFAPNGTPVPSDWRGTCQAGTKFPKTTCNNKIIGARYYVDGFGRKNLAKSEFISPRDGDGHGSHTASTAAGNAVEDVVVESTRFGDISGMAPGAKIAAYKVCWTGKVADGCMTSDMVEAIDDAVADGVDVINFSIGSGTESPVYDPTEIGFLNAAAVGVFVAASAGNSGPGESTLDHPSPWLTTVAASTHKVSEKKLVLGDGREFFGASATGTLGATPMVLASAAPTAGVTPAQSKLCGSGSLDPAAVAGRLVVCERGTVDRVEKSRTVRDAGGAGMVLINPTANSLNADLHYVPTIHLNDTAYGPVTSYVSGAGSPTGSIVALAPGQSTTPVPVVAEFSSRGPSTTTGGDILKPDVAAPGVDVLAAVTPFNHSGRNYDLLSGTSMAAPHIAGIAAVLRGLHPTWSPMAVKSAMMTTARDTVGTTSPFAQGAGNVQPTRASSPLAVFDHGIADWIGYLKNEGVLDPASYPTIPPVSGTDLNQASISMGSLVGAATTYRTLTNVSATAQTFTFSEGIDGIDIIATPATLTIQPGAKTTVALAIQSTTAPIGAWTTGSATFTAAAGTVRLPVAVRPLAASIDNGDIDATGDTGTASVKVTPGYSGTMTATVHGLASTTPVVDSVTTGAFDYLAPADSGTGVESYDTVVAADSTLLRWSADGADTDDLDLWVYQVAPDGSQTLVGYSASGSADEEVTIAEPAAGTYRAYVHGFSTPAGGSYTWRSWDVGGTAAGDLTVAPTSTPVAASQPQTFALSWNSLATDKDHLGWVRFADVEDNGTTAVLEVR